MFNRVLVALAVAALAYVGFLILKAYKPQWFKIMKAGFQDKPKMKVPVPEPEPTPGPAPAPPVKADPPPPEKVVTPAGPNGPNVKAEPTVQISPEAQPIDPYESGQMQAPIHDTVSHPELSFGPGVEQTGKREAVSSVAPLSSFSPEFAQNGGSFMGSVFANDLQPGDDYATA